MTTVHNELPPLFKGVRHVGIAFVVLGLLAVILPNLATLALELFVAATLFVWGLLGVVFALSIRPVQFWASIAIVSAITLITGLMLILYPVAGVKVLTIILIAAFLIEGLSSMHLGLVLRRTRSIWVWLIFSGACSFALGLLILSGWPGSSTWILGLLIGLNFISSGAALIMASRTAFRT